ncbi:hypothetical protein OG379_39915 (plasmid) [Streptomyces sp. NBC_01166]|uniref:hypothetical protein n=1 Tax=Streptomyces sp. NBC_01166 TaxID=2903755 RepID=UPI002F90A77A|nr:hypothetical protein OG379_39915 [Streptomyces sp. NBC_01166]
MWLEGIAPGKIADFAAEAGALDAAELRDYESGKRTALLACLVHTARRRARDDLAEMFCRRVATKLKNAKDELEEIRKQQQALVERMIGTYRTVLERIDPADLVPRGPDAVPGWEEGPAQNGAGAGRPAGRRSGDGAEGGAGLRFVRGGVRRHRGGGRLPRQQPRGAGRPLLQAGPGAGVRCWPRPETRPATSTPLLLCPPVRRRAAPRFRPGDGLWNNQHLHGGVSGTIRLCLTDFL